MNLYGHVYTNWISTQKYNFVNWKDARVVPVSSEYSKISHMDYYGFIFIIFIYVTS